MDIRTVAPESRIASDVQARKSVVRLPKRIACMTIDTEEEAGDAIREMYSKMKHGDPDSVEMAAVMMAEEIGKVMNDYPRRSYAIASSAFGSVPTAAFAVMKRIISILEDRGHSLTEVKVDRAGDFQTTHYGSMGIEERLRRMRSREISIDETNREAIRGKTLFVIDDVHVTGSHEVILKELLSATEAKAVVFCYLIKFTKDLAFSSPQTEESFNHAAVKSLTDLEPFFGNPGDELILNARTVKFILNTECEDPEVKLSELDLFLSGLPDKAMQKIYAATTSADGYHRKLKFRQGFKSLSETMIRRGLLSIEDAYRRDKNWTALHYVTVDGQGDLRDMVTGENLNHIGRRYSLMKYGSVADIGWLGNMIADKFIARLEDADDELIRTFMNAAKNGEYITVLSPASRNVESAQKYMAEIAIRRINVWLALHDLPTMILVKISRFGSGEADYSRLSAKDRARENEGIVNRQYLPETDFFGNGTHVAFFDDTRITGSAADWIETKAMERGACSFFPIYCVVADPEVVATNPAVEDYLNRFVVTGSLDEHVAYILNQEGFKPVQRLLRLLFKEENRPSLGLFLDTEIRDDSLLGIYEAGLGNDYAKDPRYAASMSIVREVLKRKGLIGVNGLPLNT